MREPKYILEHFSKFKLSQYQQIFSENQFTKSDKFTAAVELLNIDPIKFRHIPFLADKQAFLDYKYNLLHFELYADKYDYQDRDRLDTYMSLAKQAVKVIQHDQIMTKHQNQFSKFAQGLSTLFQRTGNYNPSLTVTDFSASVISIGAKKGGIEPGFMAAHHQDVIMWLSQHFKNDEESLIEFINLHHGDIEKIFEQIKDKLPTYLYKLDYKTEEKTLPINPGATAVFLTEDDVKRTSNVKKSYKIASFVGDIVSKFYVIAKKSNALKINIDAILETLSNDFSSFFMLIQKQQLFVTTHTNESLKFMPQAEWVTGAEQFGSDKNPLVGSNNDTNNYRGVTLLIPRNGLATLTDNSILNASRLLVPLLFSGDYDKIGSKGQNLLIVPSTKNELTGETNWQIVGIDFGHMLRNNNPLIGDHHILADGRFTQPGVFKHPFKNFSALSDGSLSEKMQGAMILARLRGDKINDAVIASYGDEFYKFYNNIPPGEGIRLCDSYVKALQTLQSIDYANHAEYGQYISAVLEFQHRMLSDLNNTLKIFESYLHYPAKVVDMADNLNKLCAAALGKTSLRSTDGKHGLNHIVIHQDYLKTWNIASVDDHYIYSCSFTNAELMLVEAALKNIKSIHVQIKSENGKLSVKCKKLYINEIAQLFNETFIKNEYHRDDYKAIEAGYNEIRLRNLVTAPWFNKHDLEIHLGLNPSNKNQYRISLNVIDGKKLDGILLDIISKQFSLPFVNNYLVLDFDENNLHNIILKLETILQIYESYLEQVNNMVLLSKVGIKDINNNPNMEIPLTVCTLPNLEVEEEKNPNQSVLEQTVTVLKTDIEPSSTSNSSTSQVTVNTFIQEPNLTRSWCILMQEKSPITEVSETDNFKYLLKQLLLGYNNDSNVGSTSTVYKIYSFVKEIGKTVANNTVWHQPSQSLTIIPTLQNYIADSESKNTDEIITLLEFRKTHVTTSLVKYEPDKYKAEIELLELAINCGKQLTAKLSY